ncbi:hypothetical protein, partial [Actinoplanes sp. RD1]|uniref:hypothetical protein n=1 Tax=Actinoplanes sp. RD1 TaxID=3064538 RepID=UPI0027420274
MPDAQQRHNRGKTHIIERLSHPDANKPRRQLPTERRARRQRIKRRPEPAGRHLGRGRPQLLGDPLLLNQINTRLNRPLERRRRRSHGRLSLAVQGRGLTGTPRRIHRHTSVCALKPYPAPADGQSSQ